MSKKLIAAALALSGSALLLPGSASAQTNFLNVQGGVTFEASQNWATNWSGNTHQVQLTERNVVVGAPCSTTTCVTNAGSTPLIRQTDRVQTNNYSNFLGGLVGASALQGGQTYNYTGCPNCFNPPSVAIPQFGGVSGINIPTSPVLGLPAYEVPKY